MDHHMDHKESQRNGPQRRMTAKAVTISTEEPSEPPRLKDSTAIWTKGGPDCPLNFKVGGFY